MKVGKIPYCGKEVRKAGSGYRPWTESMLSEARELVALGFTEQEIAEELGVTRGAVLNALSRHQVVKNALTAAGENPATL